MKLIDIQKIYGGNYLSYYKAKYQNQHNHIKEYELISRCPNLDKTSFGKLKVYGVGIIGLSLNQDKVILQKEFRLACNNYVYNFPAGLVDEGEDIIKAIKRELQEETGLEVVKILDILPPCLTNQGLSDEAMQVVIAIVDGNIKPSIYENEEIEAKWYTKEEVKELFKQKVYMSIRAQTFLYQWIKER